MTGADTGAPVGVAVVGLGFMGSRWARALAGNAGARVAVVCDVDAGRAQALATELGTSWTTDVGDAVARSSVHGVVVATPDHLHETVALAALEASVPVAVEKPFAHDVSTASRIAAAAEQAGTPVLAGHVLRFEPRYAAMRETVASGAIGAVQAVRSERLGVLADQDVLHGRVSLPLYYGTHELDLARWVAGEITSIAARHSGTVLRRAGYDVDDLYSATLGFASGAHGTVMLGWSLPSTAAAAPFTGFTVIGEHGALRVDQGSTGLTLVGTDGPIAVDTWYAPTLHGRVVGALAHEAAHFVDVVSGRAEPLCTAADGLAAVQAALALERSAELERIVPIEEVH